MNKTILVIGIGIFCLASALTGCKKKTPVESPQPVKVNPQSIAVESTTSSDAAQPPKPIAPSQQSVQPAPVAVLSSDPASNQVKPVIMASDEAAPGAGTQSGRDPGETQPSMPDKIVPIADNQWTSDYDSAVKKAVAENKNLLLNFSGSDWCPACIRLDNEVFSREEFRKNAGKLFVMVTIDFPQAPDKITPAVRARNQKLQERYGIEGYPTVILADSMGRPYAQTGYKEGGPEAYMEHLNVLWEEGRKLRDLFTAAAKTDTPALDRAKLLDQALSMLPGEIIGRFYISEVDQIIEFDSKNEAGLRNKYLLNRQFSLVQDALKSKNYGKAKEVLDVVISELKPTGAELQNVYFARAKVMHFLQNAAGEKESLQKALEADPDSPAATQIRRMLDVYFPKPPAMTQSATIETNLKTYQTFLPERAFDGNEQTYFWSAGETKSGDQFTLILDEATPLNELKVLTGAENTQQDRLYEGVLEVSDDGLKFERVAEFKDGIAIVQLSGRVIKAVRIRCTKDQTQWLVIREIQMK